MSATAETPEPGWLKRLLGYCLRHRRDLNVAIIAAIVGALLTAAVPLVIRHVIDQVLSTPAATTAWAWGWDSSSCWPGRGAPPRFPAVTAPDGCHWMCSTTCVRTCSRRWPAWTAP